MTQVILTHSDAAAGDVRREFGRKKIAAGEQVWEMPEVLSLGTWIVRQWEFQWPLTQRLHGIHELALYEQALLKHPAAEQLISPRAFARECQKASRLLVEHDINFHASHCESPDQHLFLSLRRKIQQRCTDAGWTLEEQILPELIGWIENDQVQLPDQLTLMLDEEFLSPIQQRLIRLLLKSSTATLILPAVDATETSQQSNTQPPFYFPETPTQQHQVAAHQIFNLLDQARLSDENFPSIAVVCPELRESKVPLQAALKNCLIAESFDLTHAHSQQSGPHPTPWIFQTTPAATENPWIRTALQVLSFKGSHNSFEDWSALLLNPMLWSTAEADDQRFAAARLEVALRDFPAEAIPWPVIYRAARKVAPSLINQLRSWHEMIISKSHWLSVTEWIQHTEDILKLFQWLEISERIKPDNQDNVLVDTWQQSLVVLRSMEEVLGKISAEETLDWLQEILTVSADPMASDPSNRQAPIHILSPDKLIGRHFEHWFILDGNVNQWPAKQQPSALIPAQLQRGGKIAASNPQQQLQLTEHLLLWLRRQQQTVWFCPTSDADGNPQSPSALIQSITQQRDIPVSLLEASNNWEAALLDRPSLKVVSSDPVPPVSDDEKAFLRGGVGIIADQLASPIFGFARRRLGMEPLRHPDVGLAAMEQGNNAHRILDKLWKQIRNSTALRDLPDEVLRKLIDRQVNLELEDADPHIRITTLEKERLAAVIHEWMQQDLARAETFEVVSREEKAQVDLRGLPLELRPDRIDRVIIDDEPLYLIIDYKTGGVPAAKDWRGDSLLDPQLPIYAHSAVIPAMGLETVDGIAIARVKEDECQYALISTAWTKKLSTAGQLDGSEWERDRDLREAAINAAIDSFLRGTVLHNPEHSKRNPSLAPLCRELADWIDPADQIEEPTDV